MDDESRKFMESLFWEARLLAPELTVEQVMEQVVARRTQLAETYAEIERLDAWLKDTLSPEDYAAFDADRQERRREMTAEMQRLVQQAQQLPPAPKSAQ